MDKSNQETCLNEGVFIRTLFHVRYKRLPSSVKWHRHGGFVNQQNFVLTKKNANLNEAGDNEPSWQYRLSSVYSRVVSITEKNRTQSVFQKVRNIAWNM